METILRFNEFGNDRIDEGWLHNLALIGSMILANVSTLKGQDLDSGFLGKKTQIEQMESNLSHAAMVGYLVKMPHKSIEEKAAIKEARIYFEDLRDGKTPRELSPMAKKVVEFAVGEAKKLDGRQLYQLSQEGLSIFTKN
jgi:hypothetical protein